VFLAALIVAECVNETCNLSTDWNSLLLIPAEEEKEEKEYVFTSNRFFALKSEAYSKKLTCQIQLNLLEICIK
jgi:hypothetical protein